MNLRPGDKLEVVEQDGRLIITPVVVIPRDQMWFYSKEWQQGEARVNEDIKEGKVRTASSKAELFHHSQRLQVLKAIDKVSDNPLPQNEGGYGKPGYCAICKGR
ncbi:AbrB/MazE/SpoVT family DNA-binding domain-containing protein [Thermincola ferriacetica]|uniref:AbrB/MazE/SpoVT family DNA-binding domain-containing protein n=1 Tax=Thermincola ferriacetica TaxID=281456 RepID=UPI001FA7209B|nr:AbrB/MazE/SpoVT family DNA-binding domain-containing protein [Thermincola ferriacetica]